MGCVKMQNRKMKDMKNAGQVQHNTTHRQFTRKLECNDRQEHRNSNNILITNLPMIQWEKKHWNVNINRHSYKTNVANTNVVLIKRTEILTITATCELPVCCIFMSRIFSAPFEILRGRLKMQYWKMRDHRKCRGGICRTVCLENTYRSFFAYLFYFTDVIDIVYFYNRM